MKRLVLLSLFSFMILCILFPGRSFPAEDGDVVVDVESSTTVKNDAVGAARNAAIQGALQKAVEQATGNLLTTQSMEKKAKILRGSIFLKADQYIQTYRIVGERTYGGTYTVIARVTVSLEGLKNDLRSLGLAKELPQGLPAVPVSVTVRGINNYKDYSQFREYLQTGVKGVEAIHQRSLTWETANMEVNVRGGVAFMAAELLKVKQFPIKTTIAGDNALDVVFIR